VSLPSAPREAREAAAVLLNAAEALHSDPSRTGSLVQLAGTGQACIAGDLHDNLPNLARLAASAALDNPTHHLVVQELIHGPDLHHGCDLSHRMLLRIAGLVLLHPGQVHPLLGNHELAQLLKRGVSKGGGNSVVQFQAGLDLAFGEDAEMVSQAIDTFVKAMPLAVRTAGGVCCAHSMPEALHMHRFDADVLQRSLSDADRAGPFGSAYLLTWGRRYDDDSLASLADAWDVTGFVLGHMHADMGVERRGERVVIINSDHERGVLLHLDLEQPFDGARFVQRATPLQMVPLPEGIF
jgi:hypothetical protein